MILFTTIFRLAIFNTYYNITVFDFVLVFYICLGTWQLTTAICITRVTTANIFLLIKWLFGIGKKKYIHNYATSLLLWCQLV